MIGLAAERHGQLDCLRLSAPDGANLLVSRFGAQLLSWRPAGGGERLFLSANAALDGRQPIRGGVPLVFPQFANLGPLPAHGLVRTAHWHLQDTQQDAEGATVTLALQDDAASRALWPHAFACQLRLQLAGRSLAIGLQVINPGAQPMAFQAALHTYLRVADAHQARVEGLAGAAYIDRWTADSPGVQHEAQLAPASGLDRIYPAAPGRVLLREPSAVVEILSEGFPDLVVWNPGPLRAPAIADLEPGGQHRMVCIEAAAVVQPVSLAPGQSWSGSQRLTLLA